MPQLITLIRHLATALLLLLSLQGIAQANTPCAQLTHIDPANLFNWTPEEQFCAFPQMEKLWPTHSVITRPGAGFSSLPQGKPLLLPYSEHFMQENHVYGLLVLHHGQVVLEHYQPGFSSDQRWVAFSMSKSVTSILAGLALQEGAIHSLNDPVSEYLPELAQSAYAQVTIQQLLTMTSGIRWDEDYQNPHSDLFKSYDLLISSESAFLAYMAALPRQYPAGSYFNYSTGEANILGAVIRRATGQPLATYLSQKIWQPMGMQEKAIWLTDLQGNEMAGNGLSATLQDYGRIGLFMLGQGIIDHHPLLPGNWVKQSSHASPPSVAQHDPYGYQWWIDAQGAYQAQGIFGQLLYIDPRRNLVIVMLSAWPQAEGSDALQQQRADFINQVLHSVDRQQQLNTQTVFNQ
ncbi:MAG: serine hydrolase domain-containing protein [Enterobacteriaceae bacterium]